MTLPSLTLVLGGASSGKSSYAERIVIQSGQPKTYLATSRVYDEEMREKVNEHIIQRGDGWVTVEEPLNIANALWDCARDQVVLLDCATMWLTNVIMDDRDLDAEMVTFIAALSKAPCPIVVVSNEIGLGIVPENALARRFRIAQGQLNAQIAAVADSVVFVTAGLPMAMKGVLPA